MDLPFGFDLTYVFFSVDKTAIRNPTKVHAAWDLMPGYTTWCMIIKKADITYRISWSWSVHRSKLQERQPPRERTRARGTCLLYSFVSCCLLIVQTVSSCRGLFIFGWSHVEIEWKCPHMTFVAQEGFKVRSMEI